MTVHTFAALLAIPEWHADALCAEPAYARFEWFPQHGARPDACRAVCQRCLVRVECLEFAMNDAVAIEYGTWGGTVPQERKRLRKLRRAAARPR